MRVILFIIVYLSLYAVFPAKLLYGAQFVAAAAEQRALGNFLVNYCSRLFKPRQLGHCCSFFVGWVNDAKRVNVIEIE